MTAAPAATSPSAAPQDEPLAAIPKSETWARVEQWTLAIFIVVPFAALVAAIPVAWGWGLHWRDIVIAAVFYAISGHGITVGFHRFFTHGAFKANRGLKIALAVSGTLALEGPIVRWVADHRRHHAYSDKEGDPHSPWMYGGGFAGTVKGFWHAHMGWLFDAEQTNQQRFAPDLLADPDIRVINKYFGLFTAFTLLAPAAGRRAVVVVVAGRAERVLLGRHRAGRAAAPHHVVGEQRLPHGREAAVPQP